MDKRVVKTKLALRQALFELLETKRINEINVTELCGVAGINRRTFYIHYDKIEDIFSEYESEIYFEIVKAMGNSNNIDNLFESFDRILKANFIGFRQLCLNEAHYGLVRKLKKLLFNTFNEQLNVRNNSKNKIILTYLADGLISSYILWFKSNGEISETELNRANHFAYKELLAKLK